MLQKRIVEKKASQDLVLVMGPSHNIVGVLIFTKKMIYNKRNSWRILLLLPKALCPFLLWKANDWSVCHAPKSLKCVPNHKQMVQHAIPTFVVETMDHYVMPTLNYFVTTTIISFDWWMFTSKHDTFTRMINFINSHWVPCHVTMGLFEAYTCEGSTFISLFMWQIDYICEGWKWQSMRVTNCSQKTLAIYRQQKYKKDKKDDLAHRGFNFCFPVYKLKQTCCKSFGTWLEQLCQT